MRRIAIINQKGGVGKTTTAVNLGAALARAGHRTVVVDLDPQANASLHLGAELEPDEPSTYSVLCQSTPLARAVRPTATQGLSLVPSHIDLSGAELELASAIGRETILRDAVDEWSRASAGEVVEFVLFDCPPSLGLLSVNGLAAADEVIVVLQTEFFALQGLSKLIEVLQLLRRRLNPGLRLAGVLPCLYDGRLRLAREVLAEIRRHFGAQVFTHPIRCNVKLAEAPSHGLTIFEYDPSSTGARDHTVLAEELVALAADEAAGAAAGSDGARDLERRVRDLAREASRDAATQPSEVAQGEPSPVPAPEPSGPSEGEALAQVDLPRPPRAPDPPAPRGGLRVRLHSDYLGEDGGSMVSGRGPWQGRSRSR